MDISVVVIARNEEQTNSHAYRNICEGHEDFWQVMSQMYAIGVKHAAYLHYDDELPSPYDIVVQIVKLSPLHVNKMLTKIKDADKIISKLLEDTGDVSTLLPHKRTEKIIKARNYINNLKEVW